MQYTWDQAKDALNRRKHHLPLAAGIDALEDPNLQSWLDDRFDYGEERVITLGLGTERILYVVTTQPNENCARIISVRRADKNETERYYFGRS